ncbi:MAG: ORF6N domain-containing protein [Phocaeicola sp.]
MSNQELEKIQNEEVPMMMNSIETHLIEVRGQKVLLDAFVAELYGVETRIINQAVKRNIDKFPDSYMFQLSKEEAENLKSQNVTSSWGGTRTLPKAFTEKGLYMLATILKSKAALSATFAIIETFAAVRGLKRELVELHKETDQKKQVDKMQHFGKVLSDIVMPDLETTETESTLELNFIIGKIKHTVKRIKKSGAKNELEEDEA